METLQNSGLWHVSLIVEDLERQAGLKPEDLENEFTHFTYKGRRVIVSHSYGEHLVVSMEGPEDVDQKQLIDGFSRVVEYQPFCKYILQLGGDKTPPLPTYEWDKVTKKERFKELSRRPDVSALVRI